MAKFIQTLKKTVNEFFNDDCMSSGAAMAYYAIFSLPPLLVLVGAIAGYFGVERQRIQSLVQEQLGITTLDEQTFEQTQSGAAGEQESTAGPRPSGGLGLVWRIAGSVLLVFSATGLFAQLQYALNRAWGVMPDPERGGVMAFVLKRVLSFGMILVVLFLLLMSLVLTTIIDEVTAYLQGGSPSNVALTVGIVLNNLAAILIATLLFAAMFKVLPDAKMAWRDMWVGALMTALLFVIGKALIGWYVQNSDLGSTWGECRRVADRGAGMDVLFVADRAVRRGVDASLGVAAWPGHSTGRRCDRTLRGKLIADDTSFCGCHAFGAKRRRHAHAAREHGTPDFGVIDQ